VKSARPPERIILIFLDGVGIGPAERGLNPFLTARLDTLRDLLGGRLPTLDEPAVEGPRARSLPLDARLGVEGTPQSGTGQTSLLTGANGAALFGRHFGPWTPVALRPLVEERSILAQAQAAGLTTAFANAYPRRFMESALGRRPAAPPLAARGAGLLTRHEEDLARGEAVASEIQNTGWRNHLGFHHLPEPTPFQAGENLGRIAGAHHLTFFAHYSTDHAGHRQQLAPAERALERVDRFLAGVLSTAPSGTSIVLASDHGNVEDIRMGHTLNPALGILLGPIRGTADRLNVTSIMDLPGLLLRALEGARGP
jgi:hypothetical protein